MLIFGSTIRQYFQKCKLALGFEIILSKNDYKMTIKTIFPKENEKAISGKPFAYLDSKNAKN